MEPIVALGIATNIVQLVDFGVRVVSKGNQIYHSADGASSANHDLETVTTDLLLLQTRLKQSWRPLDVSGPLSEDDQHMHDLCLACDGVASKLLERLNKTKAQGRHRRWKSLRQALKSVCSKQDIEDMSRSLRIFQTQLNTHLLVSLRSRLQVAEMRDSERIDSLEKSNKNILTVLKEKHPVFGNSFKMGQNSTGREGAGGPALPRTQLSTVSEHVARILQELTDLYPTSNQEKEGIENPMASDADISDAILRSLHYPGSKDRYQGVEEAHPKTFEWVFDNPRAHNRPWDDFNAWLRSGSGIYWLTGKPASGKSTLMKFIMNHSLTHQALRVWAGHTPILCYSFYFWGLGRGMQKTQAGLFRSLLVDILTANENLIKAIFPGFWNDLKGYRRLLVKRLTMTWYPWSLSELETTLKKAIDQECRARKICFFIDGLDELDGDTHELISFCQALSTNPALKLCLSSRPLLPFEKAFGKNLQLQLQDLTEYDIIKYAGDKLRSHPQSLTLSRNEPRFVDDILADIVQISSGVFLWVRLAVRSLLEGLTNSDDAHDLKRRLNELPPELHALFDHLLARIRPNFYLEQASRLLQIVYQAEAFLFPLSLSFADDKNEEFVFQTKVPALPSADHEERKTTIRERLKSRCLGLLEVGSCGNKVRYLHLTVREFLEKPEVWSKLLGYTSGTGFDATLSLLRTTIIDLKINGAQQPWSGETFKLIESAMRYARRSENSSGFSQTRLLDELDRVATKIYERSTKKYHRKIHWSAHMHSNEESCNNCPESFLTYAVGHGLVKYVDVKCGPTLSALSQSSICSLFDYATFCRPEFTIKSENHHPAMAAFLLGSGVSPNLEYTPGDSRPLIKTNMWLQFLRRLQESAVSERLEPKEIPALLDIIKIMLMHGADPGASVNGYSVLDIIEMSFQNTSPYALDEVRRMLPQCGPQRSKQSVGTDLNTSRYTFDITHQDLIQSGSQQKKRRANTGLNFSRKLLKTYHNQCWQQRQRNHGVVALR